MNWEDKIKQLEAEHHHGYAEIVRAAKAYIDANHAVRSNKCGYMSFHGPKEDPKWAEYYRLSDIFKNAKADLWEATDMEYGGHEICNAAWEWRYWKVMARKCCHYQTSMFTNHMASKTMSQLGDAEERLMKVCGLEDIYKSPNHYIEEAFPKLKMK